MVKKGLEMLDAFQQVSEVGCVRCEATIWGYHGTPWDWQAQIRLRVISSRAFAMATLVLKALLSPRIPLAYWSAQTTRGLRGLRLLKSLAALKFISRLVAVEKHDASRNSK